MGFRFSFNMLPKLLPGEKVLSFKPWLWFASGKSFPYYRIFFPVPLLLEDGFYVTDKRILSVTYMCRLVSQEYSIWFKGKGEPQDNEFVERADVGRNLLLGPYLEVISDVFPKPWYRSRRARLRLFMKDAESVSNVINETMGKIN